MLMLSILRLIIKTRTITNNYRNDIDGLRAIAIISVILFHYGILSNGYLGVDVFFVISGFLITKILHQETLNDKFSIQKFYLRRIRRIIPLTLFICTITLLVGTATMLPDDLENLAQSVIATNLFCNNILQAITTKNYWDIANEFKPLMHTWSLGIEEQFYFIYPIVFIVFFQNTKWILRTIFLLTILSFLLFIIPIAADFYKFYLIFFRFWEISLGGICAIIFKDNLLKSKLSPFFLACLLLILALNQNQINNYTSITLSTLLTAGILSSNNEKNRASSIILTNWILVAIGKISFSLYMWHQAILAFGKYFVIEELNATNSCMLLLTTITCSVISYNIIEKPFRDKQFIQTKQLLITILLAYLTTTTYSTYLYFKGGILHDIPELDINEAEGKKGIHAFYNGKISNYDKNFTSKSKIKTLIIGDSFARDWANILIESKFSSSLELSYISDPLRHKEYNTRAEAADIIFYSRPNLHKIRNLMLPANKLWVVGTKNFGSSNGIFYNRRGYNYFAQRAKVDSSFVVINSRDHLLWKERYIDLLSKVLDQNNTVPVFTPTNKFISQDCTHLTKAGAIYFASLLEGEIEKALQTTNKKY